MDGIDGAINDDGLDRPTVTPEPAPSDDHLIKLAAVSSAVGLAAAVLVVRWLRRNVRVSWRTD